MDRAKPKEAILERVPGSGSFAGGFRDYLQPRHGFLRHYHAFAGAYGQEWLLGFQSDDDDRHGRDSAIGSGQSAPRVRVGLPDEAGLLRPVEILSAPPVPILEGRGQLTDGFARLEPQRRRRISLHGGARPEPIAGPQDN